jgi:hypothetical protein
LNKFEDAAKFFDKHESDYRGKFYSFVEYVVGELIFVVIPHLEED